jgi:hypothetical protein
MLQLVLILHIPPLNVRLCEVIAEYVDYDWREYTVPTVMSGLHQFDAVIWCLAWQAIIELWLFALLTSAFPGKEDIR